MIEIEYLKNLLGDKFKIIADGVSDGYVLILTDYQIPNGDLISMYYNLESKTLTDGGDYDFEMGLFNDDWNKIDYVKAMLKVNGISINDDKELSKVVKKDYAKEFDNFAKVIADVVGHVANDMIAMIEKGERK